MRIDDERCLSLLGSVSFSVFSMSKNLFSLAYKYEGRRASHHQKARGGHSGSKHISQARSCGRRLQLYLEMADLVQKHA